MCASSLRRHRRHVEPRGVTATLLAAAAAVVAATSAASLPNPPPTTAVVRHYTATPPPPPPLVIGRRLPLLRCVPLLSAATGATLSHGA